MKEKKHLLKILRVIMTMIFIAMMHVTEKTMGIKERCLIHSYYFFKDMDL